MSTLSNQSLEVVCQYFLRTFLLSDHRHVLPPQRVLILDLPLKLAHVFLNRQIFPKNISVAQVSLGKLPPDVQLSYWLHWLIYSVSFLTETKRYSLRSIVRPHGVLSHEITKI